MLVLTVQIDKKSAALLQHTVQHHRTDYLSADNVNENNIFVQILEMGQILNIITLSVSESG